MQKTVGKEEQGTFISSKQCRPLSIKVYIYLGLRAGGCALRESSTENLIMLFQHLTDLYKKMLAGHYSAVLSEACIIMCTGVSWQSLVEMNLILFRTTSIALLAAFKTLERRVWYTDAVLMRANHSERAV